MANGGVTGYAALNAKVRVMYSTLFSSEELAALYEAADFNALITLLKNTRYGRYLDKAKDKDLNPRLAAFTIRGRLTDDYHSIIQIAPENARALLTQRLRYFELDNLKAVLRGIIAGASWDRVRFVLFPLGSETVIPAQEMVESGNMAAAVELLRGTPYYDTLSHAMKRYSTEQNIFPLEVALDLNYWRELWQMVNQLPSGDRTHAKKLVGTLVDLNNLMWAIRYRVYHQLSEEELINYTLPFGYHVRDEDIRAVAAGADIAQIVKRIFPDLTDVDSMLTDLRKGLIELEVQLNRGLLRQCVTAFVGDPFHIGIPLAYLQLLEFEIQDLTVLMEAKADNAPQEDFKLYLNMRQTAKG
jgi:V/A-type H+/Na+-transporting ATPase subunit C